MPKYLSLNVILFIFAANYFFSAVFTFWFSFLTWLFETQFLAVGLLLVNPVECTMGVSGKWFKALVGAKKSEKSQSSEHDENSVSIILHLSPSMFDVSFYGIIFWLTTLRKIL